LIRYITTTRPTILVGPPHPISNIRPVLYDALPHKCDNSSPSSSAKDSSDTSHDNTVNTREGQPLPSTHSSPYAVDEFTGASAQAAASVPSSVTKDEWAIRWKNIENDRINHLFWLDSNTRFNAAKQALISSYAALPLSPSQTEQDCAIALDHALARFYRGWQEQEEARQRKYTMVMYRRTWDGIVMTFLSKRWVAALLG